MPEPNRAQLKERIAKLEERLEAAGHELLTKTITLDAAHKEIRSRDVQLWEARQLLSAYRYAHTEVQEEETEE